MFSTAEANRVFQQGFLTKVQEIVQAVTDETKPSEVYDKIGRVWCETETKLSTMTDQKHVPEEGGSLDEDLRDSVMSALDQVWREEKPRIGSTVLVRRVTSIEKRMRKLQAGRAADRAAASRPSTFVPVARQAVHHSIATPVKDQPVLAEPAVGAGVSAVAFGEMQAQIGMLIEEMRGRAGQQPPVRGSEPRGPRFLEEEDDEDGGSHRTDRQYGPGRRTAEVRAKDHPVRPEGAYMMLVEEEPGAGGGGRALEKLEKRRRAAANAPMRRWEHVLDVSESTTELQGGGSVLAYFKHHTHVHHHRLALRYLHSIVAISKSAGDREQTLGHCANALIFIDQMVHNEGAQEVAEQVALFPKPIIAYQAQGSTVYPTAELPYAPLVEPSVVSMAASALEEIEKLSAKVAKATKKK